MCDIDVLSLVFKTTTILKNNILKLEGYLFYIS